MKFRYSLALLLCLGASLLASQAGAEVKGEKIVWKQVRDLDFGNTLYLFFQRQYFSSIVNLTVSKKKLTIPHHKQESELLLGGMYLSFGMHRAAGEIFAELIEKNAPLRIRNRAWFYLAKIRYQRDLYPEAEQAMSRIEGKLKGDQEKERHLLYANILLKQARYEDADKYLAKIKDKSIWSLYIRYNLAVSLVRQGKVEPGHKILKKIGKISAPEDKELQAIRDRANLSLGYSFIQQEIPEQALKYLRRVRLEGHLSNKALLGLGWAYDQQQDYNRALAPWLELNKRNVQDSAVQESFLATAYALGKLEQNAQALEYYKTAIEIYGGEVRRLEDSIINISSGAFISDIMQTQQQNEMGWFWELEQAPVYPESNYLLDLLASHTFQESLKNYRDLHLLKSNLETWIHNLSVFDTILETRRNAYAERLPVIQQNSEKVKNGDFQKLRDQYEAEINRILDTDDLLAMANSLEKKHLKKLNRIQEKLDTITLHRDMNNAKEKYRLLSGVIKWRVASQYGPRSWALKKNIKELDRALETYQQRSKTILTAEQKAPLQFEGHGQRIDSMRTLLHELLARSNDTLNEQETLLQDLAVYSLRQQQDRISSYLTHAQFSVAQIRDLATSEPQDDEQDKAP